MDVVVVLELDFDFDFDFERVCIGCDTRTGDRRRRHFYGVSSARYVLVLLADAGQQDWRGGELMLTTYSGQA